MWRLDRLPLFILIYGKTFPFDNHRLPFRQLKTGGLWFLAIIHEHKTLKEQMSTATKQTNKPEQTNCKLSSATRPKKTKTIWLFDIHSLYLV